MEKFSIYVPIVVVLSFLLLHIALADVTARFENQNAQVSAVLKNGSHGVKEVSQLAKPLWGDVFLCRCKIPPRGHFSRWFFKPLSIPDKISHGRELSGSSTGESRLQDGHGCDGRPNHRQCGLGRLFFEEGIQSRSGFSPIFAGILH